MNAENEVVHLGSPRREKDFCAMRDELDKYVASRKEAAADAKLSFMLATEFVDRFQDRQIDEFLHDCVTLDDSRSLRLAVSVGWCVGSLQELLLLSAEGKPKCLSMLLKMCGQDAAMHKGSYPLRVAAEHGDIDCVKMLLPLSDPKALGSMALVWAARSGKADCVRLLLPVSDVKKAEDGLEDDPAGLFLLRSIRDENVLLKRASKLSARKCRHSC